MTDKEKFCKEVTIICDTREKENKHILNSLDAHGIKHESKKLDFGDYSFKISDRDFSMQCVVELKANIDELWTNISRERERFEKEINAMSCITHSPNLIIECCLDRDFLMNFKVDPYIMQVQNRGVEDVGKYIYSTLESWSSSNRYSLNVHYMKGNDGTANLMLNIFYYYWHNYRELVKPLRN
ncbi:MAG: hypothetical protein K2N27_08195 [Ruminococcus sp.]|nr:hypothetical protein [Ruminococcus sp.]